ncbi:hypothetical protein POM88_027889 [Heracleum sosnowskyi]|uniref:Endonuclease/exonuclease/phosphatase domain-containing protein n=1 Tax=Heracleum sosnowskyi TaxID=360622 RepID=A0AAD8IBW9_9APIA|nr:hypothetical protein POM88_027889 [Heracleum sosnowskyi]
MNFLSWNCRGLGNARTVRALGDLIRSRKPVFVFLSETISFSNKIEEIRVKFGFSSSFVVDRVGRGGGLAILWKPCVNCSVLESSSNYIDVCISDNNVHVWRLMCFYGFPERVRRQDSWNLIRSLAASSSLPWYSELLELDLVGGKYTWERGRGTPDWVRERLDRAFANAAWWIKFPLYEVSVREYFQERNVLNDLLLQEETYWRQRAKVLWLEEGDTNSHFFHASASLRKKMNNVSFLKNEEGEVVSDHEGMCIMVKEYFSKVFVDSSVDRHIDSQEMIL